MIDHPHANPPPGSNGAPAAEAPGRRPPFPPLDPTLLALLNLRDQLQWELGAALARADTAERDAATLRVKLAAQLEHPAPSTADRLDAAEETSS